MKLAVVCLVNDEAKALEIVNRLQVEGFAGEDLSLLLPDLGGRHSFTHERSSKAPEAATAAGATGGVLGGVAGWLVGIGALAIPGLGAFVAAGPIMAALSGAAAGAAAGGVGGALVGMGIPEYEAKQYEGRLRQGNILISVHTETAEQRQDAKRIFEACGGESIETVSEAGVDRERERTWT